MEGVKVDLFQDEVYVFTLRRGTCASSRVARRRSTSPSRFTPRSALHITGARINGKIEPLRYNLRNGDIVDIMTSPSQQPNKDWLEFVGTTRAKAKIRNFLRLEQREKSLRLGRELLERELHKSERLALSKLLKNDNELRRVHRRAEDASPSEEMFISIGYGKLDPADVGAKDRRAGERKRDRMLPPAPPRACAKGSSKGLVRKVIKRDEGGIKPSTASTTCSFATPRCCNPLPGDDILGFITRGRGVTIHRRGCSKAFDTDPERRVEIAWADKAKINRAVQLRVVTANRPGILATVGHTFSAQGINISEATAAPATTAAR